MRRGWHLPAAIVLAAGLMAACSAGDRPGDGSEADDAGTFSPPAVLTITPSGLRYLDAISADARWLVGSEPRAAGASQPKPLVRLDRQTGEQTVLCDWADEDLGYCSLAEQGGMIPESPQLLLELVDDNAVRGWFPDGGAWLVDTATGGRTRIDTDAGGTPLQPAWTAKPCEGGCDYHQAPRLQLSTDALSGDGRVAAFCANYTAPEEPLLYVKDRGTGVLTPTGVRCGVDRSGREDDDDEWADEGMSYPTISADGAVVHVSGDQSSGGEYGRLGWAVDTVYFPGTGEAREVPGSGAMTRDGATLYLRSGDQAEVSQADVAVAYVSYDVASEVVTPMPWLNGFLATPTSPAPVPDLFAHASADGRVLLNATTAHDVATGVETDFAALLVDHGYDPTDEWGALRISGDGSMIVADVVQGDPAAESNNAVVLVTGWRTAASATDG